MCSIHPFCCLYLEFLFVIPICICCIFTCFLSAVYPCAWRDNTFSSPFTLILVLLTYIMSSSNVSLLFVRSLKFEPCNLPHHNRPTQCSAKGSAAYNNGKIGFRIKRMRLFPAATECCRTLNPWRAPQLFPLQKGQACTSSRQNWFALHC